MDGQGKFHNLKQKQKEKPKKYTMQLVFRVWNFEEKANGHTFINQAHEFNECFIIVQTNFSDRV